MCRRIYRSQCTLLQLCGEVDDGDSFAQELSGARSRWQELPKDMNGVKILAIKAPVLEFLP